MLLFFLIVFFLTANSNNKNNLENKNWLEGPLQVTTTSSTTAATSFLPPRRLQQQQPQPQLYQFDMLIPAFQRDGRLRDFCKRLQSRLRQYHHLTADNATKIGTFRVITTRYSPSSSSSSATTTTTNNSTREDADLSFRRELAALAGLPLDHVVLVRAPPGVAFSRSHAVNLMMKSGAACRESRCLVSRIDVDMSVKPEFFVHAERAIFGGATTTTTTISPKRTAFFPIVWSAFHPAAPKLVQQHLDVQHRAQHEPRIIVGPYSEHAGHWRDYGTGMWVLAGPDVEEFQFDESFQGWGGEDGDFFYRVKAQREIIRFRETGLVHLWHEKYCTKGVTVFTDTQIKECNWSRNGEKGSELGRKLLDKWLTQHDAERKKPKPNQRDAAGNAAKPIWQA